MAILRPNVSVEVKSSIGLIAQGGPATVAILGTAQWGPIDTITEISTFSEGISIFKEDNSSTDLTLIKGLDLLYANGAGAVKCVRIEDGTAAKSSLDLLGASTASVTLSGKYKGTYGDNIAATVTANATNATYRDVAITDGVALETYNNGGSGYSTNTSLITAINADSSLISAVYAGDSLIVAATSTNLASGNDGASALTQADFTDILDDELYNQDYDIIVIPNQTLDAFHTAVKGRLISRAGNDQLYSVYYSGVDVDETIPTIQARTSAGKELKLASPAVKYTNRVSNTEQTLDGSYLACAIAGNEALNWPAISSTHKTLSVGGLSVDSSTGKEYYNNSEQNTLLAARVTPVTKISGAIQPARSVTRITSTTDVFYEQNITNIINYIRKQVVDTLNPFIGKPNLERVRNVMAANIDGVLETDKLAEILNAYEATEVTVATSPDTVNVSITILPAFLINFINVDITIDNVTNA